MASRTQINLRKNIERLDIENIKKYLIRDDIIINPVKDEKDTEPFFIFLNKALINYESINNIEVTEIFNLFLNKQVSINTFNTNILPEINNKKHYSLSNQLMTQHTPFSYLMALNYLFYRPTDSYHERFNILVNLLLDNGADPSIISRNYLLGTEKHSSLTYIARFIHKMKDLTLFDENLMLKILNSGNHYSNHESNNNFLSLLLSSYPNDVSGIKNIDHYIKIYKKSKNNRSLNSIEIENIPEQTPNLFLLAKNYDLKFINKKNKKISTLPFYITNYVSTFYEENETFEYIKNNLTDTLDDSETNYINNSSYKYSDNPKKDKNLYFNFKTYLFTDLIVSKNGDNILKKKKILELVDDFYGKKTSLSDLNIHPIKHILIHERYSSILLNDLNFFIKNGYNDFINKDPNGVSPIIYINDKQEIQKLFDIISYDIAIEQLNSNDNFGNNNLIMLLKNVIDNNDTASILYLSDLIKKEPLINLDGTLDGKNILTYISSSKDLLQAYTAVKGKKELIITPLQEACYSLKKTAIKKITTMNYDINHVDENGHTALSSVIMAPAHNNNLLNKKTEILEQIINLDANLDQIHHIKTLENKTLIDLYEYTYLNDIGKESNINYIKVLQMLINTPERLKNAIYNNSTLLSEIITSQTHKETTRSKNITTKDFLNKNFKFIDAEDQMKLCCDLFNPEKMFSNDNATRKGLRYNNSDKEFILEHFNLLTNDDNISINKRIDYIQEIITNIDNLLKQKQMLNFEQTQEILKHKEILPVLLEKLNLKMSISLNENNFTNNKLNNKKRL